MNEPQILNLKPELCVVHKKCLSLLWQFESWRRCILVVDAKEKPEELLQWFITGFRYPQTNFYCMEQAARSATLSRFM